MHVERAHSEWRIEELGQDLGVACMIHSMRGMSGTLPAFGEVREISIEERKLSRTSPWVYLCMRTVASNDGPVRSIQHRDWTRSKLGIVLL